MSKTNGQVKPHTLKPEEEDAALAEFEEHFRSCFTRGSISKEVINEETRKNDLAFWQKANIEDTFRKVYLEAIIADRSKSWKDRFYYTLHKGSDCLFHDLKKEAVTVCDSLFYSYTPEVTEKVTHDHAPVIDTGKLLIGNASQLTPEDMKWLWHGFIPMTGITTIVGDGGCGKSTFCVDIAARLSKQHDMPDGQPCPYKGKSLFVFAEDGKQDSWLPKIGYQDGDVTMFDYIIASEVKTSKGSTKKRFDLQTDIAKLENYFKENPDVKLLVIDPLTSYLGKGVNPNSDTEVRQACEPLAELCGKYGVACLAIMHINKDNRKSGTDRAGHSKAFINLGRGSLGFMRDAGAAYFETFIMKSMKINATKMRAGMKYKMTDPDPGKLEWTQETVDRSFIMFQAQVDPSFSAPEKKETKQDKYNMQVLAWLLAAGGRMKSKELEARCESECGKGAYNRAKNQLPILSEWDNVEGCWYTVLPSSKGAGVIATAPKEPTETTETTSDIPY